MRVDDSTKAGNMCVCVEEEIENGNNVKREAEQYILVCCKGCYNDPVKEATGKSGQTCAGVERRK